ncbi:MAG: BLUF domain-containing protein [Bacteroidota bacterium]
MYYLIYVSYANGKPSDYDLKEIAQVSQRNNQRTGISGMLVYLGGKYLQILEGEKEAVLNLYKTIAGDPRHQRQRILIEGDINKRNFENWAMGFKMLNHQDFKDLSGLTDLDGFFQSKRVSDESHVTLIFLRLFYQKNNRDFSLR